MDTRAFLEALWPASGIYCVATPFQAADMARPTYAHRTFTSINAVVAEIARVRDKANLFFCVHTLKQEKVWDPNKRNYKTGEMGANRYRTQDNMHEARCFFFDLDIGDGVGKYTTRQEAMDGLELFLFRTGLPTPLISSSGGGFHVYWRIQEALASTEWVRHAAKLRQLAREHGLRVDPSRTTDTASVLRIVGTINLKPGKEAQPCVALQDGVETPTAEFLKALDDLVGDDFSVPTRRSARLPAARGNLDKGWDGPTRTLDEVAAVCEHVRDYLDAGYVEGGYPIFRVVGCGLIPYVEDGEALALAQAERHPRYKQEPNYDFEREKWVLGTENMPASCAKISEVCGGDACARCPHKDLGRNPLTIATQVLKRAAAPPPELKVATPEVAPPAVIVEPPYPYSRTKEGIRQTVIKIVKDQELTEQPVICPYDMFPFATVGRTELEQAFSLWAVTLPLAGQKIIKIPNPTIHDARALHTLLSDHEVYLTGKQLGKVQDLMQVWLQKTQEKTLSGRQFDHLGWADTNYNEFILPGALTVRGGEVQPCTISKIARSGAASIHKSGTLEESKRLMRFYNQPEFIKHQFIILCGLAAPLFHATGHYGAVVNAYGDSGGSKSSALYAAASLWGKYSGYVINGTRDGATRLARLEMIHTLANLPVCIDEITNMEGQEANEFVMGATQPGNRIRLTNTGEQRAARGGVKSTMMLTSANKSLHHIIAAHNKAGAAADMRVFEIDFPVLLSNKAAAREFLAGLSRNYGHIGPEFLKIYMARRDEIDALVQALEDELARDYDIAPPERFWSAPISCALVAGDIAFKAGLLPFDVKAIRDWALNEQLPKMRGMMDRQMKDSAPAQLLAAFLNDKAANTITTVQGRDGEAFVQIEPRGAIVAHHDKTVHLIHVRKDAFRDWCEARNKNGLLIIRALERDRVVIASDIKKTLGAGTLHAAGRSMCFSVDATHPEVAGDVTPPKVVPIRPPVSTKTEPTETAK